MLVSLATTYEIDVGPQWGFCGKAGWCVYRYVDNWIGAVGPRRTVFGQPETIPNAILHAFTPGTGAVTARYGLNCAFPPLMLHGFPVKFRTKYSTLASRVWCITSYCYSCVLRRCAFLLALGARKARARTGRKSLIISRSTKQISQMQILSQLLDINPLFVFSNNY